MHKIHKLVLIAGAALMLLAAGSIPRIVTAQKVDKSVPRKERSLALGEEQVKDLLFLMDTDKNGKISKKEYMSFMEAEFDRLDTDKSGELDPVELTQSRIRATQPRPAVGK